MVGRSEEWWTPKGDPAMLICKVLLIRRCDGGGGGWRNTEWGSGG
jgi:hypothetical protein